MNGQKRDLWDRWMAHAKDALQPYIADMLEASDVTDAESVWIGALPNPDVFAVSPTRGRVLIGRLHADALAAFRERYVDASSKKGVSCLSTVLVDRKQIK